MPVWERLLTLSRLTGGSRCYSIDGDAFAEMLHRHGANQAYETVLGAAVQRLGHGVDSPRVGFGTTASV